MLQYRRTKARVELDNEWHRNHDFGSAGSRDFTQVYGTAAGVEDDQPPPEAEFQRKELTRREKTDDLCEEEPGDFTIKERDWTVKKRPKTPAAKKKSLQKFVQKKRRLCGKQCLEDKDAVPEP